MPLVGAIIQARMGSQRLPGKVLKSILNKPILQHLWERLSCSQTIEKIILATSLQSENDILEDFCKKNSFSFFRGNEHDLIDRYYQCAKKWNLDIIVRITSDCPLLDSAIVDQVVHLLLQNQSDIATNIFPPSFPDGLDVTVLHFQTLETAWKNANQSFEREHVTPFFWKNQSQFKISNLQYPQDLSRIERWTLDYLEDYTYIQRVYEELYPSNPSFTMQDILQLEVQKPEIKQINAHLLPYNSFK